MSNIEVNLVGHHGDDLLVCNAARVSMNKESEWETVYGYDAEGNPCFDEVLNAADTKLIKYLAKHKHWTPFSHSQITLRIKAPIFVARQAFKHKIGMTENEISRRYVDSAPEVFMPEVWRKRASNVKQGSTDEPVVRMSYGLNVHKEVFHFYERALILYNDLLAAGVCPEQARMVLPQSMMTEWYWTGSLAAYARIAKLRLDSHAQKEIQYMAQQISEIIQPLFPVSWAALMEGST